MAEEGTWSGTPGKEPRLREFVKRATSQPQTTKLDGLYLANSPRRECWRLFLTSNLSSYLEFRKSDTLDAERLPTGRIVVWLRPDAKIEKGMAEPMPEEFLQGEFQRHLVGMRGIVLQRLLLGFASCGGGGRKETDDPDAGACQPKTTADATPSAPIHMQCCQQHCNSLPPSTCQ